MRRFRQGKRAHRQSGSVAIVAAALIVILGFIGVAMMTSMRLTGSNTTNHILATQAHYAADAGVEWACKQDSATSSPVSFASGTFEVTANGDAWVSVAEADETKRTMECEPAEGGGEGDLIEGPNYVTGSRSRVDDNDQYVGFLFMNTSGSSVTFNKMKMTWASPEAYATAVVIRVIGGTDYDKVWDKEDYYWGSGETRQFNKVSSVTIPAHYTAEIELQDFKEDRYGSGGVNMDSAEFVIDFYNGSTHVGQITVGLAPN